MIIQALSLYPPPSILARRMSPGLGGSEGHSPGGDGNGGRGSGGEGSEEKPFDPLASLDEESKRLQG